MINDQERLEIKRDRDRLVSLLEQDGHSVPDTGKFLCKYHPDKNPSAEIRETPGGFYFVCYGCDLHLDYFALVAYRENVPLKEAFSRESSGVDDAVAYLQGAQQPSAQTSLDTLITRFLDRHPAQRLVEKNMYTDPESGEADFATLRFEGPTGKEIKPCMLTSTGWQWGRPASKTPLFNRVRVQDAHGVLVVEGEKCVRAFTALGIEGWAATTSQGGSHDARRADWSPLIGKHVVVWRDFDDAGKRYERDAIDEIRSLDPSAEVYKVDVRQLGLEDGEDLFDYLALNPDADHASMVRQLLESARKHEKIELTDELDEKIESGDYRLVPFPMFPQLTQLTQALLPGKITVLCGNPGSAKSWLVQELGWTLNEEGIPTDTLFLEDSEADYQKRTIAQMTGRPEYTDMTWRSTSVDRAREIKDSVRDRINAYFERVDCLQARMITGQDILSWLEKRAKSGARVLIVDPITAKQAPKQVWAEDQRIVLEAQRIAEDYGASILFTTHNRTGKPGAPGLDGMSGGAAWTRFTHTGLWLEACRDGMTTSPVKTPDMDMAQVTHHRSIWIVKSRNGVGDWKRVACDLDRQTLRFVEYGVILNKQDVEDQVLAQDQF